MHNPTRINKFRNRYITDVDSDGIPNWQDCKPFDRTQQHIKPSKATQERINKLPIYVSDENPKKGNMQIYFLLSKEAKMKAPKAVKEVYAIIKRYPNILGKIERTAPERVIYFSYGEGREGLGFTYEYKTKVYKPEPRSRFETFAAERKRQRSFKTTPERLELKLQELEEYPKKKEPIGIRTKKQRRVATETFGHELTHVEQEKRYGIAGMEKKYFAYDVKYGFDYNPLEVEAEEAGRKLLKEREAKSKPLTSESYKKILRL